MANSPPPICLALVVADLVWKDSATEKITILGTFSALQHREYPGRTEHIGIYAALTNGRGDVDTLVQVVDENEEREPALKVPGHASFADPRQIAEWPLNVGPLVLPEPGAYRLQLYAGEELLCERRIIAHELTDSGGPSDG